MSGLGTMWKLELLRTAKAPAVVFASLFTPLFWLLVFGTTFEHGLGLRFGGFGYLAYMTPGLTVLIATFFSLGAGVRTMGDKQQGFLREVLVSPAARIEIVLGRAAGICTLVVAQAMLLLGVPALLGQGAPMPYGVLSVLALVTAVSLTSVAFVGLGMLMAVKGKNPQSFQALIGAVTLPMFFLSGALLPIALLPDWARVLAGLNPMAYAVDVARQAALGVGTGFFPFAFALAGLAGFSLFLLSMGARNLRLD